MGFKENGFLAGDIPIFIQKTRSKFAPMFSLLDDLNEDAMKMLWSFKPPKDDLQHLTATLLFCRAVQSFQGSIIMAERGMIVEARTLIRNCAESAFALGAIAMDVNFIDDLIGGFFQHSKKLANAYLTVKEIRDQLSPEVIAALEARIEEIKAEYPNAEPKGITWASVADRVGMSILYNTVYRDTSGDAAHVTLDALNRHIVADAEANIQSLRFEPNEIDLESTLSMAVSALLHAMHGVIQISKSDQFASIQKNYADRWKNLNSTGAHS